jgi:iron complex outermembrane receptor protein
MLTSLSRLARLTRTVAAAALIAGLAPLAANAAPAPDETEIVVTGARQRAEAARDVPIAVQTFSAQQIEDAGIARPSDFIALTPNVTFLQTTNVGETQVHIRGVIQPRDTEPPFAFVVDGVLVPNPNAFNQELADIAGIEVIKGPIGSIYGRNAVGGAVLINTQKPGPEFEGLAKASYETEGEEWKVGGYVSGPLGERVFARLTANASDRKGYFDNITRNAKEDPFEEQLVRGRVVVDVTESVQLDFQAGWGQVDGYAFNFNNQTAGTPGFRTGVNTGDTSIPFVGNLASFNEQERYNASARMTWDLTPGTLSAFLAYNKLDESMGGEGAADLALFALLGPARPGVPGQGDFFTDPRLFEGYGPTDRDGAQYQERNQEDASVELRFTSRDDQRFRYILGAYYIDFQRDVLLLSGGVGIGPAAVGGASPVRRAPRFTAAQAVSLDQGVNGTGGSNDNSAWAVFAQGAFDLTDSLELSAAIRYDEEERQNTNTVLGRLAPVPTAPIVAPLGASRTASFDKVQPRVSLRWKASEDLSLYATYGEGFRSGGFNPLGSRARIIGVDGVTNTTVQDAFPAETSKSYEFGAKAFIPAARLSVNGAIFFTEVENAHYFQFFPFSLARVIAIVQKNEVLGAEFDFNWKLTDNLELFGGAGILESEIQANREAPSSVGKAFPFTPKSSVVLGGQYKRQLFSGVDFVSRLEWNQTGTMYFDTDNTPGTERKPLDLVNGRIGIETERWAATLWSRNLFDEDYNVDAVVLNVPAVTTFNFVTKGTPRTVGVDFSFKF